MNSAPNRRQFLQSAGAAAALSTLPGRTLVPSHPAVPYKKAVKIGMVQEGKTLVDKFKLLKELGFDGVEMDSPNNLDPEEVLQAKAESGLPIHGVVDSVHWREPFSSPDLQVRKKGIAALETALRDSKTYGGSTVLVVPAVVNKNIAYADAWKRSIEAIKETLPLAKELGIKIAFENVWNNFLLSPVETAHYIDSFESDMVGAYFDVGNVVVYGWPEQWIRVLDKRILKIDVKEFDRGKADKEGRWAGFRVKLGEGTCDWPAVMKALGEVGFDGWYTAEIAGGKRDRLVEIATRMDKILSS